MTRKLAIPVWGGQVSTTADFARSFLAIDIDSAREVARKEVVFSETALGARAQELRRNGVQVLLCGAISEPFAFFVTRQGIRVFPFVAGQVDDVVAAYLSGRLTHPRFLLPGSAPGIRRRWRHGRGFRGGRW